MKYLYAPWRQKYFENKKQDCVFCSQIKNADKDLENKVLFRAKHCYGVMNLYPYSPGHFMILPLKHEENIENLDRQTWQEMSDFVRLGVRILKEHLKAGGVNIGMNLGSEAGAGIAQHCHYHLVPRWAGDTNFITTIAQTRVCSSDLEALFKRLKIDFDEELKKL